MKGFEKYPLSKSGGGVIVSRLHTELKFLKNEQETQNTCLFDIEAIVKNLSERADSECQ